MHVSVLKIESQQTSSEIFGVSFSLEQTSFFFALKGVGPEVLSLLAPDISVLLKMAI